MSWVFMGASPGEVRRRRLGYCQAGRRGRGRSTPRPSVWPARRGLGRPGRPGRPRRGSDRSGGGPIGPTRAFASSRRRAGGASLSLHNRRSGRRRLLAWPGATEPRRRRERRRGRLTRPARRDSAPSGRASGPSTRPLATAFPSRRPGGNPPSEDHRRSPRRPRRSGRGPISKFRGLSSGGPSTTTIRRAPRSRLARRRRHRGRVRVGRGRTLAPSAHDDQAEYRQQGDGPQGRREDRDRPACHRGFWGSGGWDKVIV